MPHPLFKNRPNTYGTPCRSVIGYHTFFMGFVCPKIQVTMSYKIHYKIAVLKAPLLSRYISSKFQSSSINVNQNKNALWKHKIYKSTVLHTLLLPFDIRNAHQENISTHGSLVTVLYKFLHLTWKLRKVKEIYEVVYTLNSHQWI